MYRAGSVTAAVRELATYKLDLVGVQEVRFGKRGTVGAGVYNFVYGKGKRKRKTSFGNWIYCTPQTMSAVKRVEFVSDTMSCIVLKGRWFCCECAYIR